ncbi:MAG: hypothetical protein ACI90M_002304, partial [Candidatus Azotimanducaceae bacterium]
GVSWSLFRGVEHVAPLHVAANAAADATVRGAASCRHACANSRSA